MKKIMLLTYYFSVKEPQDLRKILSANIRNARASMRISQAKLAEYAEISVYHLLDIEYCKSWVSDKTLEKLARALNKEPYELLASGEAIQQKAAGGEDPVLRKTVKLVNTKKVQLRKQVGDMIDDLVMEILKIQGE